jgi:hypothetical protein
MKLEFFRVRTFSSRKLRTFLAKPIGSFSGQRFVEMTHRDSSGFRIGAAVVARIGIPAAAPPALSLVSSESSFVIPHS